MNNSTIPHIKITDMHKSFGDKHVLKGVNLEIAHGESLVIIGGSGCGKSVMLKCILRLVEIEKGKIELNGKDIVPLKNRELDKVRKQFGMLFQGAALFDSLSAWQNVAFYVAAKEKLNAEQAKEFAIDKLKQVGLSADMSEKFPDELSGGMQKRVALARAIAAEPDILFFDEPTTGLDPIMSNVINDLIRSCVSQLGATAISITHDLVSARQIGDKVAMLHEGKFIWQGAIDEMDTTNQPHIHQFVRGQAEGPIHVEAWKKQ